MKHNYLKVEGIQFAWHCTVCNCSGGELASECPGSPITEKEKRDILRGELDYRYNGWIYRSPVIQFVRHMKERVRV